MLCIYGDIICQPQKPLLLNEIPLPTFDLISIRPSLAAVNLSKWGCITSLWTKAVGVSCINFGVVVMPNFASNVFLGLRHLKALSLSCSYGFLRLRMKLCQQWKKRLSHCAWKTVPKKNNFSIHFEHFLNIKFIFENKWKIQMRHFC